MKVVGLSGGIAAGKTSVANVLRSQGYPIFSADKAVKGLYRHHHNVRSILRNKWPDIFVQGNIDWKALRKRAFENEENLNFLEELLHPKLRIMREHFVKRCLLQGHEIAVLDIPLLIETGAWKECDEILEISAPHKVRKERALKRNTLTEREIDIILKRQSNDNERRRFSTYEIDGIGSLSNLEEEIQSFLEKLKN